MPCLARSILGNPKWRNCVAITLFCIYAYFHSTSWCPYAYIQKTSPVGLVLHFVLRREGFASELRSRIVRGFAEIRAPVRGLRRPCVFSKKEKKEPLLVPSSFFAEREGFEPPEPLSSTVFKTAAIDHSAISPSSKLQASQKFFEVIFWNRVQKYCFFATWPNIFLLFFLFLQNSTICYTPIPFYLQIQ